MIKPEHLIAKFQYAVDNKWGYIWGAAGGTWTQAQQNAATNKETKEYGQKWVGHRVADCSGLFSWAFKQLGGYMYHGSNTMWNKYCTAQGNLINGKRSDGKELKPGTALFTNHNGDKTHVGLYIGNGKVIEASWTKVGVIVSSLYNDKWKLWGELKGVDYNGEVVIVVKYATVVGGALNMRQDADIKSERVTLIPNGSKIAVVEEGSQWCKAVYNEYTGYVMTQFLKFDGDDEKPAEKITITISKDCALAIYEALKFSLKL